MAEATLQVGKPRRKTGGRQAIDLAGQHFSRWLVLDRAANSPNGQAKWNCRCDCGTEKPVLSSMLRNGFSQSCGCMHRDQIGDHSRTHGQTGTPEFICWSAMLQRALTGTGSSGKRYKARDITVCDRWLSFDNFYTDMGPRPSPAHTIERIDNNKGYYLDNCCWATPKEQARNRSNNRYITARGETLLLVDWAERLGCESGTIWRRIMKYGWSPEEAVTTPPMSYSEAVKRRPSQKGIKRGARQKV